MTVSTRVAGMARVAAGALFALSSSLVATHANATTFSSTGACVDGTYIVPAGITQLHVMAEGAQGGNGGSDIGGTHHGSGGTGGPGSKVVANIPVTPGQTLYVNVATPYVQNPPASSGAGGGPGGSTQDGPVNVGGEGGAATWISMSDPTVSGGCAPPIQNLLIVAAGGGGGGAAASFGNGGAGGTETTAGGHGVDGGTNNQDDGAGGGGATPTAGGSGGAAGHNSSCRNGTAGSNGSQMQGGYGGDGGSDPSGGSGCQGQHSASGSGGGGGGGFYGGGGGGGGDDSSTSGHAAGGGGGAASSYLKPGATLLELASATSASGRVIDPPIVTIVPFDTAPAIISTNTLTFTEGTTVNVTLQASGWPLPSLGVNNLPNGVFQDNGQNGVLHLSGSPSLFSQGVMHVTVTAINTDAGGATHSATQALTITVSAPPLFNAADPQYMQVGTAASVAINSYGGYPAPGLTLTAQSTLPPGIALVDNHDGTGRLSGTPTGGGLFNATVIANNGVGTPATQQITIRVTPIPATVTMMSNANPSVPGQAVTFSAQLTPLIDNQFYVRFDIDGSQYAFVSTNTSGIATAPPISTLAAGFHTITGTILGGGLYTDSVGTMSQHVNVTTGPASGTTLSASPGINAVYFASGLVYNRTFGDVNLGIDASGGNGLAIDTSGNIYSFANVSGYAHVRKTAPGGSNNDIGPQLPHGAYGLAIDAVGNVFAEEGDRITKIATDGSSSQILSGPYYSLRSLAADSAGNIFFVNFTGSSTQVLEMFYPYTAAPVTVVSGLNQALALAVDAADNLFIAEFGTGKVYKLALTTGTRTTIATGIAAGALAVDASGTLYIGAGGALYSLAAPYTGTPFQIDSGHSVSGIATLPLPSATLGSALTLTATTITSPAGAYPAGNVTFKEGATTLGSGALNASGVATMSTTSLPIGTHILTATYAGGAAFPTSTSPPLSVVVTPLPVPVTVTGARVHGSGAVNFNYVVGTLPSGITGVTGTLTGCTSSTSPGNDIGIYNGTIFGCTGLTPTGPSAGSYTVKYNDGGVTVTAQTLPINVVGKSIVNSGTVAFTWTTPVTMPPGTIIAGTLSGCHSTVNASTPLGTYNGTISGCSGLSVTGPATADFVLTYVDAGVNVIPPFIAVTITATKPYGGGVTPVFSYTVPASLPNNVTTIDGTLINCTSSLAVTAAPGVYSGKISGCSGLKAEGPEGPNYTITYIDGGITVTPRGINVLVHGSQLPGGAPVFRYEIAAGFPADISQFANPIVGCTTSVAAGAAAGTYNGTISGCNGLSFFTSDGTSYAITYTDAGFVVGPGTTNVSLSAPTQMADPDIFAGGNSQRHAIWEPQPLTQAPVVLGGYFTVTGAAFDSNGYMYSGDPSLRAIYVWDPSTSPPTQRRTIATGDAFPIGQLVLDSHNNIFGLATLDNSHALLVELAYPYTGTPVVINAANGGYAVITIDSSDRIFISIQGRFITMLEPPYDHELIIAQTTFGSGGFTLDPFDNLLYDNNGNGPGTASHVDRLLPPYNGAGVSFSGNITDSQTGAGAMVTDRKGNIWGSDNGALFKVPAAGGFVRVLNTTELRGDTQIAQSSPPAIIAIGGTAAMKVNVGSIAGGTPGGTVRVFEGATQLGSAALAAGIANIPVPGLAEGTHFLRATYDGAGAYTASSSAPQRVVVGRASPTIVFGNAPTVNVGGTGTATAFVSSGLTPTFATTSSACTVSAVGLVTGIALGTCAITATQAGNATFLAALPATLTITIGQGTQTITFGTAPTISVGGTGSVTATATSGLTVTYSSTSSTCSVTAAGVITGISFGPCVVTAMQAGNANYAAAPTKTQTVSIGQGAQVITFDAAPTVTVGNSAIITATGGATFNPVTFSSSSAACTVNADGAVSGVHVGNCVINAAQAGNTNYLAATASQTIAVAAGSQSITFDVASDVAVGATTNVTAVATSALGVSFSSTSATCSVTSGGTVSGIAAGDCVVNADQAGNADYLAAATVALTVNVGQGTQAISFNAAPSVVVGGNGTVSANGGGSGNAVTFSSTSQTCTVAANGLVHGVAAGQCDVNATQAGNANYFAALPVSQTLTIGQGSQSIQFGSAPSIGVGGTGTVTATATSGLGVTFSSISSSCSVSPNGSVTGLAIGTCTVDAMQDGDANYLPANVATQSFSIVAGIDLAVSIDDKTNGAHFYAGGSVAHYDVTVQNNGGTDAHGTAVTVVLSANFSNITWTCDASGGATCTASGSNNVNDTVSIPKTAKVIYHVTATVGAMPEIFSANTATATLAVGETDVDPNNNSAFVVESVGIFANGFE